MSDENDKDVGKTGGGANGEALCSDSDIRKL